MNEEQLKGPVPQVIPTVEVEYFEEAASNYEAVTILSDGGTVQVETFPRLREEHTGNSRGEAHD